MSINRKRRIFRPAGTPLRAPSRRLSLVLLTAALIVSGGTWIGFQPTVAPASTAPPGHIDADAADTRVLDGNTLMLADRTVQLAGVQAARRGAICATAAGEHLDCGAAAANALAMMIEGVRIDCALNGAGEGGRPLAVCTAGGRDINMTMVASGWARAEPGMPALEAAEQRAKADRKGLWAGSWAVVR